MNELLLAALAFVATAETWPRKRGLETGRVQVRWVPWLLNFLCLLGGTAAPFRGLPRTALRGPPVQSQLHAPRSGLSPVSRGCAALPASWLIPTTAPGPVPVSRPVGLQLQGQATPTLSWTFKGRGRSQFLSSLPRRLSTATHHATDKKDSAVSLGSRKYSSRIQPPYACSLSMLRNKVPQRQRVEAPHGSHPHPCSRLQ